VAAATEAAARWGTTTGGAHLLTDTIELHLEMERALAAHVAAEAAALFSRGYDATLAAISALSSRTDVAIVDELIHRSILDGCRPAGMRVVRFRHNDTAHLAELLAEHAGSRVLVAVAMTPGNTAAIRETLRVIVEEPEHLATMWANGARLTSVVDSLGLDSGNTATPIVPVVLGDTVRTYAWARRLLDLGIHTSAVPFAAVAEGRSRLRLCATGRHRPEDFDRLSAMLSRLADEEPASR